MADDDDWESAWDSGVLPIHYVYFKQIANGTLGRRSPTRRGNKKRSRKNQKEESRTLASSVVSLFNLKV